MRDFTKLDNLLERFVEQGTNPGCAKEVLNRLPMEFAVEAQKLLQVSLEGSIG